MLELFDEGGGARPLSGPPEPGSLIGWSRDGHSLVLSEPLLPGARIVKRDLATGARTTVRELRPEDPTGVGFFQGTVSRSGDAFAAVYVRAVNALFLATNLR